MVACGRSSAERGGGGLEEEEVGVLARPRSPLEAAAAAAAAARFTFPLFDMCARECTRSLARSL